MHWNRKDSGRNLSAQSCTDPGEPPVKKGHPAGGILVQDGKGAAYGKKDSEGGGYLQTFQREKIQDSLHCNLY